MKVKVSLSRLVEQTCVIEVDTEEEEINLQECHLYDWESIADEKNAVWEFECEHEGAILTHIDGESI